jgi:cytidylate kinase
MQSTPERLGEAFERARRHWRRHQPGEALKLPKAAALPRLTVAISRESGTRGDSVARAVGAKLDWPVYGRELIQKIAEEAGLRTELLESFDEKQTHWLLECLQSLGGKSSISGSGFAKHLAEVVAGLAAHGRCVILGRGAASILPQSATLRVRLVAPRSARIKRIAEKLGVSEREATQVADQTDAQRTEFVRSHFHKDPSDVHLYDLVLNTDRFTNEQCAELISVATGHLASCPS